MSDADNETPPELQDAKQALIKLGMDQGFVTAEQIKEHLPLEHMTSSELDLLKFTFDTMDIEVREDDE